MKRVRLCKIGMHPFNVVYKKSIVHEGNVLVGLCDVENLRILIKEGLPASRYTEVFMHESIHGINEIYELGLKEHTVTVLAIELIRFLRDNNINLLE